MVEQDAGRKASPGGADDTSLVREPGPTSRDRALGRASDAPLRKGNRLSLLKNGPDTFEHWLAEIERAERWIHMDYFIFKQDGIGRRFADAIKRKAGEGVHVRVLYDWLGNILVPRAFWQDLGRSGVEVRRVNAPTVFYPLRAIERDHRKILAIDGRYASVGGLCIADQWLGSSPETGLPYRDTAVGVEGPVVADVEQAFAGVWALFGDPLPEDERPEAESIPAVGDQAARAAIQEPGKVRILRTLGLLTSAAGERMWIADAYFLSMTLLTQNLEAAARDGVDVRVLVPAPATNDQPPIGTLSRAGYRPLLESGVRIFEYGGPMMHAKTHVVDGTYSRVGSTNLNVAGLVTNWEIDLLPEDATFGRQMEGMFEEDLANSREVILESRGPGRNPRPRPESPAMEPDQRPKFRRQDAAQRAASTASRIGRMAVQTTTGEGLRRTERSVVATAAAGTLAAGLLGARFPKVLAWPLAAGLGLLGVTGLLHAVGPEEQDATRSDERPHPGEAE